MSHALGFGFNLRRITLGSGGGGATFDILTEGGDNLNTEDSRRLEQELGAAASSDILTEGLDFIDTEDSKRLEQEAGP